MGIKILDKIIRNFQILRIWQRQCITIRKSFYSLKPTTVGFFSDLLNCLLTFVTKFENFSKNRYKTLEPWNMYSVEVNPQNF